MSWSVVKMRAVIAMRPNESSPAFTTTGASEDPFFTPIFYWEVTITDEQTIVVMFLTDPPPMPPSSLVIQLGLRIACLILSKTWWSARVVVVVVVLCARFSSFPGSE